MNEVTVNRSDLERVVGALDAAATENQGVLSDSSHRALDACRRALKEQKP